MSATTHLAIDLGAGSGRVMAGHFDGKKLRIEEINRFANDGVRLPTGWHWNLLQLFTDIKRGLAEARKRHGGSLVSLAVDTWGVDYGLIDQHGRLLGAPWMYRDSRTDGMMDEAAKILPREDIYGRTGIQFMFFNTLFQLLAEARRNPEAVAAADQLLFTPDLLTYWLSGERVIERTIASTSQLLKAGSAEWDFDLAEKMGIPARLLRPVTDPGRAIGSLLPEVMEETGCGKLRVTTCGSHDTASAVAGIPAGTEQPLFLSSGTWSLIGRELNAPIVTPETYRVGFSNEQGLNGTTRFLKNVAGMWLLQECKRNWDAQGQTLDYGSLVSEARTASTSLLLNPDADEFSRPCDMPAAITAYAAKTGQSAPASPGEFARAILESLALRYRGLVHQLRVWMPDLPDTLHIVGGGSQNALLNQMTADATGLRVVAGPVEATAAGNILAQLMATGEISSLEQGREIIRASFDPEIFEPKSSGAWDEKAARFESLSV
ncbi:MAG: rhamnulokinase [Terrimicrobiaceae bacterium]